MKAVKAFGWLLRQAPTQLTLGLFVTSILSALTEGIGLLLLPSLLQALQAAEAGTQDIARALINGLQQFGFKSPTEALLIAFVALMGLRSAVVFARDQLGMRLQHQLVDKLRAQCFEGLLSAEWRWLSGSKQSTHESVLLTDINRVGMGLHFGIGLVSSLVTLTAYVLTALALSWSLTALALLSGGLLMGMLARQQGAAIRLGQNLSAAHRGLHDVTREGLSGVKLAKILGVTHELIRRMSLTLGNMRSQQLAHTRSNGLSRAWFQTGGAALLAAYVYVGLHTWHTPVPVLLTLVLIFGRVIPMLGTCHQQAHQWLHSLPALRGVQDLLHDCKTHAEPVAEPAATDMEHAPLTLDHQLCLQDVTIRHTGRSEAALGKVNACFKARTTTAIMGPSGAGKSTLADVLMGLLAPDEGTVLLNGKPLTAAHRAAWRRQVSYVPQEVFLFHDSIRANLRWGKQNATDAEMREALQCASADFVFALPRGLDTQVGDGGVRLSGGERQRIALARALLQRPTLLILDEATSALDLENEQRVRDAIERLHGDLTVVIIGHRLPTLEHADQVLVLQAGQVHAQGTWDQIRQMQIKT